MIQINQPEYYEAKNTFLKILQISNLFLIQCRKMKCYINILEHVQLHIPFSLFNYQISANPRARGYLIYDNLNYFKTVKQIKKNNNKEKWGFDTLNFFQYLL